MKDRLLSDKEHEYIADIFFKFQAEIELRIEKEMHKELSLLSKYKSDLAQGYVEVANYKRTLAGLMESIQSQQESLFWVIKDLIKVITGEYPKSIGRVAAEEFNGE